jgi:hypothetical protein
MLHMDDTRKILQKEDLIDFLKVLEDSNFTVIEIVPNRLKSKSAKQLERKIDSKEYPASLLISGQNSTYMGNILVHGGQLNPHDYTISIYIPRPGKFVMIPFSGDGDVPIDGYVPQKALDLLI